MPGDSPTSPRPRGFAITDLLGLEAELSAGPGPASDSEVFATAPGPGPGFGGPCLARGAIPLGLGLLCGLGAQPPAPTRAPCLLLANLPFLTSRKPEPAAPPALRHPLNQLGRQKRSESVSTSGNQACPSRSCPGSLWVEPHKSITEVPLRPYPQHHRSKGSRDPRAWRGPGEADLHTCPRISCLSPNPRLSAGFCLQQQVEPVLDLLWWSRRPSSTLPRAFPQLPARGSASENGVNPKDQSCSPAAESLVPRGRSTIC